MIYINGFCRDATPNIGFVWERWEAASDMQASAGRHNKRHNIRVNLWIVPNEKPARDHALQGSLAAG
jgi:hypothetical protein